MQKNNDASAYIASFLCGLLVYGFILIASGKNEAWDDGSYYVLGMPAMCLCALICGYKFPLKVWRWALSMAGGQFVGALMGGASLSLLPFALIFMVVISLPQLGAALLGAKLSRSKQDTAG